MSRAGGIPVVQGREDVNRSFMIHVHRGCGGAIFEDQGGFYCARCDAHHLTAEDIQAV